MMNKYLLLFFVLILSVFISCSKDESEDDNESDTEESDTTNLTPAEKFSTSLMADFLNEEEDDALELYLEEVFYPQYNGKYKGASITKLGNSVWLITTDEPDEKNFTLQKFVNMKTDDYYFKLKETKMTIEDILKDGQVRSNMADTTKVR
jgi:hypothetical protein